MKVIMSMLSGAAAVTFSSEFSPTINDKVWGCKAGCTGCETIYDASNQGQFGEVVSQPGGVGYTCFKVQGVSLKVELYNLVKGQSMKQDAAVGTCDSGASSTSVDSDHIQILDTKLEPQSYLITTCSAR